MKLTGLQNAKVAVYLLWVMVDGERHRDREEGIAFAAAIQAKEMCSTLLLITRKDKF